MPFGLLSAASKALTDISHWTGLDSPTGPSLPLMWVRMGLQVPKTIIDRLNGNSVCPQWTLPEETIFAMIRVFATSTDHGNPMTRMGYPQIQFLRMTCSEKTERVEAEFEGHSVKGYWIGTSPVALDRPGDPTILYIHGGSFVTGHPLQTCHAMASLLYLLRTEENLNTRIFALEYPLAPENPYPAASDASVRAIRWLIDVVGIENLIIIGDSAGGNLTLSSILRLRDQFPPAAYLHHIVGCVPISPYVDFLGPRMPPHVDMSLNGMDAGLFTDYLGGFLGRAASRYYTGTKPYAFYKTPDAWPVISDENAWDGIWLKEWEQILGIGHSPANSNSKTATHSEVLPARSRLLRRMSSSNGNASATESDTETSTGGSRRSSLQRRYSFVSDRHPPLGNSAELSGVPFPHLEELQQPYYQNHALSLHDLERIHLTRALDPYCSPYRAATFANLPPMLFVVGSKELLSFDILKCVRKARRTIAVAKQNGKEALDNPKGFGKVDLIEEPVGVHVYLLLPEGLVGNKGISALKDVAGWISSAWKERKPSVVKQFIRFDRAKLLLLPVRFLSAYAPGLEEFTEAALFWIYLRDNGRLATATDVAALMGGSLLLPPDIFACGLADLTGELMRLCINHTTRGSTGESEAIRAACAVRAAARAWPDIGAYSSSARSKWSALEGSLRKVEGGNLLPSGAALLPPTLISLDLPQTSLWAPLDPEYSNGGGGDVEGDRREPMEAHSGWSIRDVGASGGERGGDRGGGRWADRRGRGVVNTSFSPDISEERRIPFSLSDAQLIESIEARDVEGVRRALMNGADPNCRKRVLLGSRVFSDSKSTKDLFRRESREKGTGPSEIKVAAASCESALALAIIVDSLDIVQLLLQAGADTNIGIEWRIIKARPVWTEEIWSDVVLRGWDITFTFESGLEFALLEGTVTDHTGSPVTAVQERMNNFHLMISKAGALVKLDNPTQHHETLEQIEFVPNLEMIPLLLSFQARPTKRARAAIVRYYSDPQLLQRLEDRHRKKFSQQPDTSRRPLDRTNFSLSS
ncbi:hypothetical protein HDU93_007732 [Gonapodya sp. JEL0774]|nr:hypothetical protein HDU93_007732 [Gonapodya sp. JEL0774]